MTRIILDLDDGHQLGPVLARGDRPVKPAATFEATDQLGEIVIDNPPLNLFSQR